MNCTYCSKEMQDATITAFDLQRGYEEVPFCSVSCLQQWLTGKTIGMAVSLVLGTVMAAALAAGMGVSGLMFFFVPYMLRQCHGLLTSDAGGIHQICRDPAGRPDHRLPRLQTGTGAALLRASAPGASHLWRYDVKPQSTT